ncbi:MAG: hypothetical protein C0392_07615 [Syntrophus sp. (in: bacteria)]|nr:hypothetical protein [Syntrophus sp. (in: bacteria)]
MKNIRSLLSCIILSTVCSIVIMCTGCAERGKTLTDGERGAPLATLAEEAYFGIDPGYTTTDDTKPLGNTKWQVIDITPKPQKVFLSRTLQFYSNGDLLEITTYGDGTANKETYQYDTVGATLAIKKPGSTIDARFKIDGNQMFMDTGEYSLVLKRIKQ